MSGTGNDIDQPAFARGMAGPYGKYVHEVKTHLDEDTYNLWLRLCNSKEVTSSELQRDLLYLVLRKRTPAEITSEDRRSLLQDSAGRVGGVL